MIKFALLVMLSLSLYGFNLAGENISQVSQKKLADMNAYNEMVRDLKSASSLGHSSASFFLGALIYNGITLENGEKIEPNVVKGIPLLQRALSNGSVAAIAMLTLKSIERNDLKTLTDSINIMKNISGISLEEKDYYFQVLASYLLDKKIKDAVAIELSMKWLYLAEKNRPTYKMQFLLANMYSLIQNTKAANFYLNKSCQASEMKNVCSKYNTVDSEMQK